LKTSIIIPCWNNLEFTQQCLEAIDAYTPEDHEVILIDNASTDGTGEWIREQMPAHPEYKLIVNPVNIGAAGATNQGIEAATGDYLCFLNNDAIVSKEWLTGLIECVESADDIGMVGPKSNNVSGPQMEMNTESGYDSLFKYQLYAETYRKAHKGLYIPYWRIIPFCGLVSRKVIDKVGMFDEQFYPGNFGDDDLCLRIAMAGYRNLICHDVFVHHHGSQSMKKIDFNKNLEECKVKFDTKWKLPRQTISAVMIVKDEEENIEKCLSSLIPIVDEVVVVDTGSTDQTKAIAATLGDKIHIYDYKWNDDFSAPRNFANQQATGDWLLSIDADEVITGLDKIELKPYTAYRIVTRNYNNNPRWTGNVENEGEYPNHEQGMRWFPSTKIRLWPNDKRIHFQYPVHEVVEQSVYHLGMQIVESKECIVHHYGRLDDNYEYGRGDKYWKLLNKQLESGVNNLRTLEQLALQAQSMRKFEDARKFWDEIMVLDPSNKAALLNKGHCYAEEGNWKDALIWSRKALDATPDSKEAAMNTATCECMAGDRAVAVKMCEDLIAKYPTYPLPQGLLNALKLSEQNECEQQNKPIGE